MHGPKILSAGVDIVPAMESMTLPSGYLLPEGTTMADVRRLDRELLASEGLKVDDLKAENGRRNDGRKSKQ